MTDTPWSDEAREMAVRLYGEGMSAGQVASALSRHLGVSKSRNAVIGLLHRKKLMRSRPSKPTKPRVSRKPRAVPSVKPAAPSEPPELRADPVSVIEVDIPPPTSARLTLMQLGPLQCKWPEGEGPFTFCGAKRVSGSPYCQHHRARASGGMGGRLT